MSDLLGGRLDRRERGALGAFLDDDFHPSLGLRGWHALADAHTRRRRKRGDDGRFRGVGMGDNIDRVPGPGHAGGEQKRRTPYGEHKRTSLVKRRLESGDGYFFDRKIVRRG